MEVSEIKTIEEYIEYNNPLFNKLSNYTFSRHIGSSSVIFGFDYSNIIEEVCFARMYSQISGRKFSSNYIMRLPYDFEDKNNELHKSYVDYPTFFSELKDLVCDTYDITVHNTRYPNIKVVIMKNKIDLRKDLNYCLSLILFTMIRGTEGENIYSLKNNYSSIPLTGNLKEYMYQTSKLNRGSHHNINDSLDKMIKIESENNTFLRKLFNIFIDTLNITFGKDGIIHNPNYQKYFAEFFDKKPNGYGNTMQTKAFEYINKTTNRIIRENIE